jgi:AcrR family transcriptional regulator
MEDAHASKSRERASRILDAAADLLLRWGYKRITMEDIARQAEIGTGTIYLHWKTKEALFEAVMLREAVAVWRTLLARIRLDPEEVLLHRVMRSVFLVTRQRPLARALFTRDRNLLGKLVQGPLMPAAQQIVPSEEFVAILRHLGLLRLDMSPSSQAYAFSATVTGFSLADPFVEDAATLSLEEKADAMAQIIRRGFEPEDLPSRALLQEKVVPRMLQLLEHVCDTCEARIHERMVP